MLNRVKQELPSTSDVAKGWRKQGNIVVEAKMHPGRKKCFWKISKAFFASKMQILCFQHMLHGRANEESLGKH